MDAEAPIAVFDSGLGGLTVAHAIRELMPAEHLVYLGDTARVPYGTRSSETVIRYARRCAAHLRKHGVKLLVVACNTVSAVALDMLRVELDIPVLGVIEPGAKAGVDASHTGRIGVIATAGTVSSGAYVRAAAAIDSRAEVFSRAAPLLVPLVEEGWTDGEVPRLAVHRYVEPLVKRGIDALVLGCTHYPLLKPVIEQSLGELSQTPIAVVDSAHATARELHAFISVRGGATGRSDEGTLRLLVTDLPDRFAEVAGRFMATSPEELHLEQVDL